MYLQFIQPAPYSILSAANVTVKCTNAADSNNAGHICFNVYNRMDEQNPNYVFIGKWTWRL